MSMKAAQPPYFFLACGRYSAHSAAKLWVLPLEVKIKLGTYVHHPRRGPGRFTDIDPSDARNKPYTLTYETGEVRHYSDKSAHKFQFQDTSDSMVNDPTLALPVSNEVACFPVPRGRELHRTNANREFFLSSTHVPVEFGTDEEGKAYTGEGEFEYHQPRDLWHRVSEEVKVRAYQAYETLLSPHGRCEPPKKEIGRLRTTVYYVVQSPTFDAVVFLLVLLNTWLLAAYVRSTACIPACVRARVHSACTCITCNRAYAGSNVPGIVPERKILAFQAT